MNNEEEDIDEIAKRIYMANWKELPNRRYPPVWENTSEEVKNWVRNQARAVLGMDKDKQPSL